jgi:hypothetical protein
LTEEHDGEPERGGVRGKINLRWRASVDCLRTGKNTAPGLVGGDPERRGRRGTGGGRGGRCHVVERTESRTRCCLLSKNERGRRRRGRARQRARLQDSVLAAEEKEGGELGRLGFAGLGDFKEGRKLPRPSHRRVQDVASIEGAPYREGRRQ